MYLFSSHRVHRLLVDLRENRGRGVRSASRRRLRRWGLRLRSRVARTVDSDGRWFVGDFGPNASGLCDLVESQLTGRGIGYMMGGRGELGSRVLHLEQNQIGSFCRILLEHSGSFEVFLESERRTFSPIADASAERLAREGQAFDVFVVEDRISFTATIVRDPVFGDEGPWPSIVESREHIRVARLRVAIWTRGSGAHGMEFAEISEPLPIVSRLRLPAFERFMSEHHDFDADLPAPPAPRFEIDVVYTWVDDSDEEWSTEKEEYAAIAGKSSVAGSAHVERFRNRDELKYSLRSLELFAPWVRNIYIVTADQRPRWLDTSHPKINLVSHRDIYRDTSWLPTFNSSSIETQLHHIPGLADHFIYFNDDVMLGQMCDPADFFHANGVMKYFESTQRAFELDIDSTSEEYIQADRNAIALLANRFDEVGRSIMLHVPHPASRLILEEMEELYPESFAACASSRFRSSDDLRPIAFMQFHYGFQTGAALPSTISHRYLALWKHSICSQMSTVERRRAFKTLCINDVGVEKERSEEVNRAVHNFLEAYYPSPSSYEVS